MATSPSHQLGEAIGDFFESAIINYLRPVISRKGYYLDYRHPRPARGNRREVIGTDLNGNKHKLDIVIEKGGSETEAGIPKAFIEMAWRRYVKHSKNKVQEIAGAILPLVEKYAKNMPFYAAVLAGEFTENALSQLRSQGFYVLYFSYSEICSLFESTGLSIHWEENTSESELQNIVDSFRALKEEQKNRLLQNFFTTYQDRLKKLADALCEALDTTVSEVVVTPVHGITRILESVDDAVKFIADYDEASMAPVLRYEISVRYSSGDEYMMKCTNKTKAIQFLNQYIN
ncbi:hypothetical protein BRYFOR_05968 [Marvinbryantia formatexigens DSM 14469]|uniref:DNA methylase n=1 Tax=Marvinbryantia formatexigens DSM 14469 TaxID=478749 RepID=C6LBH3_9FIRM|nr:hypothetical protein [Marvinbryantia formatexigens]EET62304.1 hypothetical protein BRYFOR_05968 [Marvinbryantia formatexigens DSM 14469]UWO26386.1 hypothetical protein NQ534_07990 [Marvinbryantia formatexigens DSM 14469]SDF83361.1 hypothetical protein SAMN05660368_01425 [Marvinbryantia formatexigens]